MKESFMSKNQMLKLMNLSNNFFINCVDNLFQLGIWIGALIIIRLILKIIEKRYGLNEMLESKTKKIQNFLFNQFAKFQEIQLNFFMISAITQFMEQKFVSSYDTWGLILSILTILSILLFQVYILRQMSTKSYSKTHIQDRFDQYAFYFDDLKVNEYFQQNKIENDYTDYLNLTVDYWRINFHFIGFLKKLIILTVIISLREYPSISIPIYIVVQILLIILMIMIVPFINVVMNFSKIVSEIIFTVILSIILRCLVLFNNLSESDISPNENEIMEYLELGKVLNIIVIVYISIQVFIFIQNIYNLLSLISLKRKSNQQQQNIQQYVEQNKNMYQILNPFSMNVSKKITAQELIEMNILDKQIRQVPSHPINSYRRLFQKESHENSYLFDNFRQLLETQRVVEENPYLQTFQILKRVDIHAGQDLGQDKVGTNFKNSLYFLTEASYSKIILCNSVFQYSYNMRRLFFQDQQLRLYNYASKEIQLYETSSPKLTVGADVIILDKFQNKIHLINTQVEQIFFESNNRFQRIRLERSQTHEKFDRSFKYQRNTLTDRQINEYLGGRIMMKFSTTRKYLQNSNSQEFSSEIKKLFQILSKSKADNQEEQRNQKKVPFNIMINLYSTNTKKLVIECEKDKESISVIPGYELEIQRIKLLQLQ